MTLGQNNDTSLCHKQSLPELETSNTLFAGVGGLISKNKREVSQTSFHSFHGH